MNFLIVFCCLMIFWKLDWFLVLWFVLNWLKSGILRLFLMVILWLVVWFWVIWILSMFVWVIFFFLWWRESVYNWIFEFFCIILFFNFKGVIGMGCKRLIVSCVIYMGILFLMVFVVCVNKVVGLLLCWNLGF